MRKLSITLLIIISGFVLPLHTTRDHYQLIFKALHTIERQNKDLKAIDQLLTLAKSDLEHLDFKWDEIEQNIAILYSQQKSVDRHQQIFVLQNKQAILEEQIADVEAIILQLEQEKETILNPPPIIEPTIVAKPELAKLEDEIIQKEVIEQITMKEKATPRKPEFIFIRGRRDAQKRNKEQQQPRPPSLLTPQQRTTKVLLQNQSLPFVHNPRGQRMQTPIRERTKINASIRRFPHKPKTENSTPEQRFSR